MSFVLPTALVSNWIANPSQNYGLLLKPEYDDPGTGNNRATFWFATSESLDDATRPKLELTFTPAAGNIRPLCCLTSPGSYSAAVPGQYLTLSADASDPDGTIGRVDFYSGSTLVGVSTSAPYSVTWSGIPAGDQALKAVAYDNGGACTTSAVVNARFTWTVCSANMNSSPGWTLGSGWAYGKPLGIDDGFGYPDPSLGYTATNVVGYNLNGSYGYLTNSLYATMPVLNCSSYSNVTLTYWYWLGVEGYWDNAAVEVSSNGSAWTTAWANPSGSLGGGSWRYASLDISAIANRCATVYVRWRMGSTDNSYYYGGWNIDDVRITGTHVAPSQDLDKDGQADTWEVAYFGSTNSAAGNPNADADNDGMLNVEEYTAGTDPNNPNSRLALSMAPSTGNQPVVSFPTVKLQPYFYTNSGRYYGIWSRTNLCAGTWTGIQNWTNVLGTNQTIYYTNTSTTTVGLHSASTTVR